MATRREAVAGAAGFMLMRPEVVFGSQANSAVSFGIVGTGARGTYVGRLMTQDPRARLSAVCDLYADRIEQARKNIPGAATVKAFQDYRQLLAEKEIDAVYIATPVYLHPEHFEAAVEAGKHVYCEKPAGADVAGVKRTLAAGQKAAPDRTIQFGFQQRFSPEYRAAHALVEAGELGEPKILASFWLLGMTPPLTSPAAMPGAQYPEAERRNRTWLRWRDLSGGDIVECDCHGLDRAEAAVQHDGILGGEHVHLDPGAHGVRRQGRSHLGRDDAGRIVSVYRPASRKRSTRWNVR